MTDDGHEGFDPRAGWLLTKAIPRKRRRSGEVRHQAEYYQDLVRALGIDPVPVEPRITVSAQVRARATELLEQHGCGPEAVIIGIAPGAAFGHAKRWPSDRFADLIAMLRQERGATCVLVGSAGDRDAGYAIESSLGSKAGAGSSGWARPNMVNLIGRTDLLELVGVPLINPVWCRPCMLRERPMDHRCMKRVSAGGSSRRSLRSCKGRLLWLAPA